MLDAIKDIGETALKENEGSFIFSLIDDLDVVDNKGNPFYLITFNFDLTNNKLDIQPKELDKKSLVDYLWIGNAKGNNSQDRLTTTNASYLLSKSLPNLTDGIANGETKNKLLQILNEFFINIKGKKPLWLLDLSKVDNMFSEALKVVPTSNKDKEFDKFVEKYSSLFFKYLQKELGLDQEEIKLFSVVIDGKKPSELEDYINYLGKSVSEDLYKEKGTNGICHICGEEKKVTYDPQLPAKFYITKQIVFSSEFKGNNIGGFSKNFVICEDCRKNLMAGIAFVDNYLNSRLANNTLWIIPGLLLSNLPGSLYRSWYDYAKNKVESIFTFDKFIEFSKEIEKRIEDYQKFEAADDYAFVDLLFYKKDQQAFKIRKLIEDVPMRRINQIRDSINEVNKLGNQLLFPEDKQWLLTLNSIYYLFPVRKTKKERGEDYQFKEILNIYESIFLKKKLERESLIIDFIDLFRIYRFEKFNQYNIPSSKDKDIGMIYAILKTNLLLKLFERLNLIEGGVVMTEDLEYLSDDFKNYITEMNFGEEETSLFLLGYLIAEIGNAQRSDQNTKKPILNKINFHGISPRRLIILSNEVFDKLDQYKVRQYNEKEFSAMKKLMDKHLKDWKLRDEDNVYYILSGYAFNTYKRIKSSKREEGNGERN